MADRMNLGKYIAMYRPLLAVLLIFTCLSFFYSSSIPPFEGPDGPEHYAYIIWLAEGKGFPPQGEAAWETPVRQEAGQPPLYYLLASLPVRLVDFNEPTAEFRPNPHFPSSAPGHIPDNKNIAIHYPADDVLQGGWLAIQLARGVSFLFGILLIISVYKLGQEFFPDSAVIPTVSALITAVIPQAVFMSNVVSNDMAAGATGALTLWLLARLVKRGPTWRMGLALGLAFGLSALSKTGNLALGLPVATGFGWLWWQQQGKRRQLLSTTLFAVGGAVLIGGWWYLRSWTLYGSPLGLDAHYLAPWALSAESIPSNALAQWTEVFYSFWAAFGWGNIKFPAWIYYPFFAFVILAGIGLILKVRQGWRLHRRLPLWLWLPLLALTAVIISLAIWMTRVTAPHGRLLFPALTGITLLLVIGWEQLGKRLLFTAVAYLSGLTILSLMLLIQPAYAKPDFFAAPSLDEANLGWLFGDFARLTRVTAVEQSVTAGEELPVSVCWETVGQATEDYTVSVQLVGPENQIVGRRRTYPGLGSYPTSTWEAGKQFCDEVRVAVSADLDQTLQYQIEIAMLNESGERAVVLGGDGRPRDHLFAAAVRLETADPIQLAQTPAGNDPIRLYEADFSPIWHIESTETVLLQWWLAESVEKDYTVFVHLRDVESGENVAQGDGPPAAGWYPTSLWEVGEVVVDEHEVTVTADVPSGEYELVVGWYDPVTGERLGSEVSLGTVEVVR